MFNYFTRQTKLKGWAAEHVIKYQPYASNYYSITMLLNEIETHIIYMSWNTQNLCMGCTQPIYVLLLTQRLEQLPARDSNQNCRSIKSSSTSL